MSSIAIKSEISGTVWKIECKPGDALEVEGILLILEAMKMEIPVLAPRAGRVTEFRVSEGGRGDRGSGAGAVQGRLTTRRRWAM